MSLTRTKRDNLPGCSRLLCSRFCECQVSVKACHSTSLLATGMKWELDLLPPAQDANHKKHCCSMKTLRLKDAGFTGSGEQPLWKTQVNNSLPAPADIPECGACQGTTALVPRARCPTESSDLDCSALIPYIIFLGPCRQHGAWTELQPALRARMLRGSRRALLHQVILL